ncbi:hypothetical protein CH373_10375 [Leptospira perolatii]|uniref:Flagellar protein FlgN n=1 Tax=Leptospira perolatii TaxID=2023191 RepID=A0A2M9ZMZ7_9LEPT|nr:hypothetical protein [Leptospira perolatii]PJZ68290.1 hypothetical protein CH360_17095 [Leptospira perolatii]PJZ73359.1 hypothetical protein CH373_10375 [Leptospira perolatii]
MAQTKSRQIKLFELYSEKISILDEVISNQKRQLEILSHGDGEGASKIEKSNLKCMHRMMSLDRLIERLEESSPQTLELIQLTSTLFQKLDESRNLNEKVGQVMESILREYQKELNTVQAQIQLKKFLAQRKFGWKTGTC